MSALWVLCYTQQSSRGLCRIKHLSKSNTKLFYIYISSIWISSWGQLTTWFWAQMETTPLEMEAIIGRTGCHCGVEVEGRKEHILIQFQMKCCLVVEIWTLQQHPTGALLWFHVGSSPGFQCSFPKCRGHAAWLNQPRCIHHHQKSSSASTES